MRKVLIVGAGQSGLQLACGLLDHGYGVTVVSNRSPEDIRSGRIMSSQCMFGTALQTERDVNLGMWDDACPPIEGISVTIRGSDGGKAIDWAARLRRVARSVDQRVKMPAWIDEFERRGGRLLLHDATEADLEEYTRDNDLVIAATGKGKIGQLFERDARRSPYSAPQRAVALTYVTGMEPRKDFPAVCFNGIPGVGEYVVYPGLTTTGPCEIMNFFGLPGGPMDCWDDVKSAAEHLERSLSIIQTFVPWEAERCRHVALSDENGVLSGRIRPTVRRPVGKLPSGSLILGIADVVVLNDPLTGQGANNAAKAAADYLECILNHEDRPFDRAFMEATFERCWEYIQASTVWTNALLAPLPQHVLEVFVAAEHSPSIASRFVNGFDNPRDYFCWFMDPERAAQYLAEQSDSGHDT